MPGASGTLPKCKRLTRHTFITYGVQRRLAVSFMHSGGDRLMLVGGYTCQSHSCTPSSCRSASQGGFFDVLYGAGIPGGPQFV
jgi:hypothetical protein